MTKASIVDGQYVGVRLSGNVTIGIGSPALSNVTGIAVDFFSTSLISQRKPDGVFE